MAVSNYSTTPSSNATISGTNVAENCPAGNVNNAIRQLMADIRAELTDAVLSITAKATVAEIRDALDALQATDAVSSIGALTPAADQIPYYTGPSAASLATLTSFARTLLDDADAATARTTLGALSITASQLSGNGYIKLSNGLYLMWGSFTAANDSVTTFNYSTISGSIALSSFSRAVVSGTGSISPTADENWPATYSCSTTGFTIYSSSDAPGTAFFIAVGV